MNAMEKYKVWMTGSHGYSIQVEQEAYPSKLVYCPPSTDDAPLTRKCYALGNLEFEGDIQWITGDTENVQFGYKFANIPRIFNNHWICNLRGRCNMRKSCMGNPFNSWNKLLNKGYRRLRK